jgi:hypothetical protein
VRNGIYIVKNISATFKTKGREFANGINENQHYLYQKNDALLIENDKIKKIDGFRNLRKIKTIGDTIFILSYHQIDIIYKGKIIKKIIPPLNQSLFVDCYRIFDKLYVFSLYEPALVIDLHNFNFSQVGNNNDLTNTQRIGNTIIVHSKELGFSLYDSKGAYELLYNNKRIYNVEDFCITNENEIYVLNENNLSVYILDTINHRLKLKLGENLQEKISDFLANWVVYSKSGEIFLIAKNAIIKTNNGKFSNYVYLGNRELEKRPFFDNYNRLIINAGGYTTILENKCINKKYAYANFQLDIPKASFEGQPVILKIKNDNYFIENNSLKRIEIKEKEKVIYTTYIVGSDITLPGTLIHGNYNLKIYCDDSLIYNNNLIIEIPLEKNPLFNLSILFISIIILFLYFKIKYNRKVYTKRMLSNRLEILYKNLNPHFIFNSLNLIYSNILEGNKEEALNVLRNFAQLQRNFIERSKEKKVTLESELNFIKRYLSIEQLRYKKDISFFYKELVKPGINLKEIDIPSNILQPLIENALKYGILTYTGNELTEIIIIIEKRGGQIILAIENPKSIEKVISNDGLSLGLSIVTERINIYNEELSTKINFIYDLPAENYQNGYRIELIFNP